MALFFFRFESRFDKKFNEKRDVRAAWKWFHWFDRAFSSNRIKLEFFHHWVLPNYILSHSDSWLDCSFDTFCLTVSITKLHTKNFNKMALHSQNACKAMGTNWIHSHFVVIVVYTRMHTSHVAQSLPQAIWKSFYCIINYFKCRWIHVKNCKRKNRAPSARIY